MTGSEHYQEAERLLAGAQNVMEVAPIDGLTRRECAELAQVHATLALTSMVEKIAYPPQSISLTHGGAHVTDH
jgi:hypothetical protein